MEILDDNFKRLFEYIKTDKRKFDFFDIIPPKEILVSKWVEFILNPLENGIGNLPLSKLLELTNKAFNLDELAFQSIETEVTTDNLRRIDIFIKYDGLWVVIENKLESYENNEQTTDYYKYVESVKGNNQVIYIYLKPNYNNSLPLSNAFNVVTYDKFIDKLKEISEFDFNDKDRYKYLKEFIISGGRFMKSEEIEMTESLRFYIDNIDKFESIAYDYKEKNKKLFNLISDNVLATLNIDNEDYKATKSVVNYIQFYKDNWKNIRHTGIHYEIMFNVPYNNAYILGKKLGADMVIHIENSIDEFDLINLRKNGITKKGSLAYFNNIPIKEHLELDFTTSVAIKKSIDTIVNIVLEYKKQFEEIIDKSMK